MLYVRLKQYDTVTVNKSKELVDHIVRYGSTVDINDKGVVLIDYDKDNNILGVEVLGHALEIRYETDFPEL